MWKQKRQVTGRKRGIGALASGVSSSSHIILPLLNLLCLHAKLADCGLGGFLIFEWHWRCGSAKQS